MARPGQSKTAGYRGHFGRMGFEEVLTELEARRDAGAKVADLVDLVPTDLMGQVGYFGRAAGAPEAMQRLSRGLEEAMVRLISVRSGDLDGCVAAIRACQRTAWSPL